VNIKRCAWAGDDPLYVAYHDCEWGVPEHDDRRLFEMIVLDGAQAGLSWITILRKRENYRRAFDGFDAEKVARYGAGKVAALLGDAGIVRNRMKIESAIRNARVVLDIRARHGSLDRFLWSFVDGRPIRNEWRSLAEIPCESAESKAMSRELKRLGCNFVGPTICYAFMQAAGMVNDHVTGCFRYRQVQRPAE
jgi:DNA-3-methyladenine glycosylase I